MVRRSRRNAEPPEATPLAQSPPREHRRRFAPLELLNPDELDRIHNASMTVLEDIGLDIVNSEARQIFGRAGARVEDERVCIGRDLVDEALQTAPETFTYHARNPANTVIVGGDRITFKPVAGPPNCSDHDNGRRPGTLADAINFVKLSQVFNCLQYAAGASVEPQDVHASLRHLHMARAMHTLTDKPVSTYVTGRKRFEDGLECVRIARQLSHEQLRDEPSLFTVVNVNSPLKLDDAMAMGIIEMARAGQICCVTPFTLAGAMAPVTMAGALVQQNAEALAGLVLSQLARPGAPFVYGGFTSNVDMKSGAPAFGTPEYLKAVLIGGQLARRYKLPYRTSNTCAANAVDAQAAYESVFSLWGTIMGGGNIILHSAGWMEGGLVASYEKFALDCDLIQMIGEFLQPLEMTGDALGLDAIRDVGPGGHFFGTAHTLERYREAFYQPMISDWRNFEQWQAAGSPEAKQAANRLWKQALNEWQAPAMDDAVAEELDAFIDRRIAEGGQPTDF